MPSKVFRYKRKPSLAYTPGLTSSGPDGNIGKSGENGTALYFCDYDLNNSYYIDTAMGCIENNQTLTSSSRKPLENRSYKKGDIIITRLNSVYTLVDSSNSGRKFDIKYIGDIKNETEIDADKINSLTIKKSDKIEIFSPYPSPGTTIPSTTDFVDSEYLNAFNERAVTFIPRLDASNNIASLKDYTYRVHMYIKNTKSISSDSYTSFESTTVKGMGKATEFYKKITFDVSVSSTFDASYAVTIPESFLDKLHVFGNDIRYNILNAYNTNGEPLLFYHSDDASTDELFLDDSSFVDVMLKYPANNIEIYSNADMRMNGAHGLINFAYRDTTTERDNVMGGSSVYFSSMPEDSSVSNLFSNECENFIYNAIDNLFIVSMTDKDGNEIYIMPNITFRD